MRLGDWGIRPGIVACCTWAAGGCVTGCKAQTNDATVKSIRKDGVGLRPKRPRLKRRAPGHVPFGGRRGRSSKLTFPVIPRGFVGGGLLGTLRCAAVALGRELLLCDGFVDDGWEKSREVTGSVGDDAGRWGNSLRPDGTRRVGCLMVCWCPLKRRGVVLLAER